VKNKSKKPTLYGEVMVVTSVRLPSHIMKEVKARYGKVRLALERLLEIEGKVVKGTRKKK
jgi:hypothetical protein